MQRLEAILQIKNKVNLDSSLLFFSGAMAPMSFKPAFPGQSGLSADITDNLLAYTKSLSESYGINSSSIKPNISDSFNNPQDKSLLNHLSEWSKEFKISSSSIKPELPYKTTTSWNIHKTERLKSIELELAIKTLSAPSHALIPKNNFNHDWSFKNSTFENFSSPSSSYTPFKTKTNLLEPFKIPETPKLPEFKTPELHIPKFDYNLKKETFENTFEMPKIPSWEPEIPKFEPPRMNLPQPKHLTPDLNPFQINLPKPNIPNFDYSLKKETFGMPGLPNYKKSLDLIEKEPLNIYLFNKEVELHLHHDCSGANLQMFGKKFKNFDSYESAMIDYRVKNLGFKPIIDSCNKFKGNKRYLP